MGVKYDQIGSGYNTHRKADPYLAGRMRVLLQPTQNNTYLDVGCGTGNYTTEVFKKDYSIIGIDPSETMLEEGRKKNNEFSWRIGTAEQTNLPDESVNGILASLTIHHWKDLNAAFREMNRILIKGGSKVIFTSSPKQMKGYWLNHYFPKMLEDSIKQMPALELIERAMINNGFKVEVKEPYFVKNDLQDLFLYAGKHRPELYLDETVRRGISSFSDLANAAEVQNGLKMLEDDIKSERLDEIVKSYENSKGDYLFIKAVKG